MMQPAENMTYKPGFQPPKNIDSWYLYQTAQTINLECWTLSIETSSQQNMCIC